MSNMNNVKQARPMILILLHCGHCERSLCKCRVMADGAGGSVCFISGSLLCFFIVLERSILSSYESFRKCSK